MAAVEAGQMSWQTQRCLRGGKLTPLGVTHWDCVRPTTPAGEDFVVNQVYTALFNIMGIWPLIYACLLIPGGRSDNKVGSGKVVG
jgi:hypothetical protein